MKYFLEQHSYSLNRLDIHQLQLGMFLEYEVHDMPLLCPGACAGRRNVRQRGTLRFRTAYRLAPPSASSRLRAPRAIAATVALRRLRIATGNPPGNKRGSFRGAVTGRPGAARRPLRRLVTRVLWLYTVQSHDAPQATSFGHQVVGSWRPVRYDLEMRGLRPFSGGASRDVCEDVGMGDPLGCCS